MVKSPNVATDRMIRDGTGQTATRNPGPTYAAPQNPGNEGNGLVLRVGAKRAEVGRFLRAIGARRRRLVSLSVVAAAISTLLTAPAALGGKPLADWLTEIFGLSSPAWRILCAFAALCSQVGDDRIARA
jgi:hypothetical protein